MLCDICAVDASSANHSAGTLSLSLFFVLLPMFLHSPCCVCAEFALGFGRTLEVCVVKRPNVCLRFQMCSLVRMDDRKSSSTGIFPCNVSAQRAAECVRINQCINTTHRLRCPPSPDVSGPISLRRLASLCCKCTIIPYRKIAFAILGKNHAEEYLK